MKKFYGLAGLCVLITAVVLTGFLVAGCGNSDSGASAPATDPMAGGPPMPGGPPGPPGPPGAGPGGPPMPGMPPGAAPAPGAPGAPMAGPPGAAPAAPAATPSASGGTAAPGKAPVPFTSMTLNSPAQRVSYKSQGATLEYLRFKYTDWDGKVCLCELPVSETKEARTRDEWLATFDIYKQPIPDKKTNTKPKQVDNLNDFPFVSPRPAGQ